eukprot:gene21467-biopygen2658
MAGLAAVGAFVLRFRANADRQYPSGCRVLWPSVPQRTSHVQRRKGYMEQCTPPSQGGGAGPGTGQDALTGYYFVDSASGVPLQTTTCWHSGCPVPGPGPMVLTTERCLGPRLLWRNHPRTVPCRVPPVPAERRGTDAPPWLATAVWAALPWLCLPFPRRNGHAATPPEADLEGGGGRPAQ